MDETKELVGTKFTIDFSEKNQDYFTMSDGMNIIVRPNHIDVHDNDSAVRVPLSEHALLSRLTGAVYLLMNPMEYEFVMNSDEDAKELYRRISQALQSTEKERSLVRIADKINLMMERIEK